VKLKAMSNHPTAKYLVLLAIFAGLALSAGAQQMMMLKSSGGFLIPELMAMVEVQDKQVVITNKLPGTRLPKEYQAIDIAEGDIILMANGKKISTAEELEKLYNEAAIGQEIKLGIKREGSMRLVSFKKADPKDMPVMKKIVMGGDGAGIDSSGGPGSKVLNLSQGGDMLPLPEMGLIVSTKDKKLKVEVVIPMDGKKVFTEELKEGDVIRSLQGKEITTENEFKKIYDAIAVGEEGQLTVERSGKTITSGFTKSKPIKIIKSN
jgi:S1-C subfamily serine protease